MFLQISPLDQDIMMKKIILDRNENNYGPAPACLEVLRQADKSLLFAYSDAYKRGVKSALSERFASDFNVAFNYSFC